MTNTITANDVVVAYDDLGAGEPLVLLHGGESTRREYDSLIPHLGDGIRTLAYDQRDTGESKNGDAPYRISDLATDCACFIEGLGLERAHLMGGSYGGLVAMTVAIEHPDRVRSLVLRSTTPGGAVHAPDLEKAKTTIRSVTNASSQERNRAMAERSFSPAYLAEHPEAIDALGAVLTSRSSEASARRFFSMLLHDCCATIDRITAPTLILHGADDPIVSVAQAEWMAERIPGARLVVFEGMRHSPTLQAPGRVGRTVREFVMANAEKERIHDGKSGIRQ